MRTEAQTHSHRETTTFIALAMVLLVATFACPLLARALSNPAINNQFLIGPIVNAALIIGAVRLRRVTYLLPIIFLPSVTAISLNLIFAVGNQFMLMMIPAIWLGNSLLVISFKLLHSKSFVAASVIGILAKAGIIFAVFNILVVMGAIFGPAETAMWSVMGVNQLITATAGAAIAFGAIRLIPRKPVSIQKESR
ncbi:MAG: hypothetical protein FWE16_05860 [Firmicutes bacterium]|nr:hypothetical protein [Bacillota bacterium]